jgi:hypothetical protein
MKQLLQRHLNIPEMDTSFQIECLDEKPTNRPERMTASIERWLNARIDFDFPTPNTIKIRSDNYLENQQVRVETFSEMK